MTHVFVEDILVAVTNVSFVCSNSYNLIFFRLESVMRIRDEFKQVLPFNIPKSEVAYQQTLFTFNYKLKLSDLNWNSITLNDVAIVEAVLEF